MKALASLSRRIARIEAQLPGGNGGLIRVGKGMRGLHEAMEQVAALKAQGLLREPDPAAPPSPMRLLREAILAERAERAERDRLSLESSPTSRGSGEETLKAEETLTPETMESDPCSPTPAN